MFLKRMIRQHTRQVTLAASLQKNITVGVSAVNRKTTATFTRGVSTSMYKVPVARQRAGSQTASQVKTREGKRPHQEQEKCSNPMPTTFVAMGLLRG